MKIKTFLYEDSEYDVSITVRAATVAIGAKRSSIQAEQHSQMAASIWKKDKGGIDQFIADDDAFTEYMINTSSYPACIAGTASVENLEGAKVALTLDITPADFMELPEQLVVEWLENIFELNPHWLPQPAKGTLATEEQKEGEELGPADEKSLTGNSSSGSEQKILQLKTKTTRQRATGISTT